MNDVLVFASKNLRRGHPRDLSAEALAKAEGGDPEQTVILRNKVTKDLMRFLRCAFEMTKKVIPRKRGSS